MRTQKYGMCSLSLAVALLVAMTSTLSAQAVESKGGPTAVSPATGSAGGVDFVDSGSTLSGEGAAHAVPLTSGWCGTDTTKKPLYVRMARMRLHLELIAAVFQAVAAGSPAQAVIRPAAYRLWLQSTIDVLPPF